MKSLFSAEEREAKLDKKGDPLVQLNKHIDFAGLAAVVDREAPRPSRDKGGRPPFPTELMVRVLVLQQLFNLSDEQLEYQLLDRLSFQRFVGLRDSSRVPDANTVWVFRERLAMARLGQALFEQVQQQLQHHGYIARCGQIVDATLVPVPTQRNSREDNAKIKQGEVPEDWSAPQRRQKDTDARWTQKHGKSTFGYKLSTSVDKRYKLMRRIHVSDAAEHDSQHFEAVLDPQNTSRVVYADKAYPSRERDERLTALGWRLQLQRKAQAGKPLSDCQQRRNRRLASPRARVEHVFAGLAQMGGKLLRSIGLTRATLNLHLKALTYNLKRLSYLKEAGVAAF